MLPLVSALDREELDSFPHDIIQAELNNWQQILFYGDMDGIPNSGDKRHDQTTHPDASSSSSLPNENRDRADAHQMTASYFPAHGSPQIPPETYSYLIHALLSLQGSASHSYPQHHPGYYPHTTQPGSLPQFTPFNYGLSPTPNGAQLMPGGPVVGSSSIFSSNVPVLLPPGTAPQNIASPSHLPTPPVTVPSDASPEQDPDQMEEVTPTTEDKRRRNTAASARFRIKKKQKTLNLERTVSDLTGRAEELEREATELRRENGWLKEIVLLKGRKLALGSQLASPAARDSQEENECGEKRNEKGKAKES
ncbi:hypothetical protein PAXRUDRAFT_823784 [Paxillus rubicundulus Ve08.2h10]|uniref:BZIP domain-containing protein n=1 Tax=Paxillus rubicundulus Ve08.2h10 TaxID=930991 RepID=A0A0D0DV57_9AGAM|nr:hypothetical protein PAXRUDRAFT_823784 [Paxillus rubicundulus Ve08.2h10]